MNNLRMIAAARDQFQRDSGRPPTSLDEIVGETKYLRQLSQVDGESYAGVSLLPNQPLTVMTPNGIILTYDPSGSNTTAVQRQAQEEEVMQRIAQKIGPDRVQSIKSASRKASEAYSAATKNVAPSPEALLPYFATPQEGADFVEVLEMEKEIRAELKAKYGR